MMFSRLISKQRFSTTFLATTLLAAMVSQPAAASEEVKHPTPVTVSDGKLLWASGEPVYLFGVNYSAPFAYGYRAISRRGIDHKAAIDMDVDHIARLKLDAYRIHVWDKLITDKQGNMLDNEYVELFDYLMMRLQERGIKAILTPIAWWGAGYPEPDPSEPGFAVGFSKNDMNEKPELIEAQQRYLTQFMAHKNRFTGKVIGSDPDIIAFELFNEPKHRQAPEKSAAYVNTLLATVRDTGVTKPLFYNLSEQGNQPDFAEAICNSNVDGVAFQWYPTGLLKYSALNTNVLPSVATYTNPFVDIDACASKAKMIYEFDAADVTRSVMYPAMARSFRDGGFQWATQFAYDPAAIADTNSDYNTHFLNLLYTPSKAISLMIAGEAFRSLPDDYQAPAYPESNQFGDVTLSYDQDLSQFDDGQQYYYSNSTTQAPEDAERLTHVAGVGSSPVVSYNGSGAYFLDKLNNDQWRLEVYPDVLTLQDPHQNSSLQREVARLYSHSREFDVSLEGLGSTFFVHGQNKDNTVSIQAEDGKFAVSPGIYLLSANKDAQPVKDTEFLLPALTTKTAMVVHQPQRKRNVNEPLIITASVEAISASPSVTLQLRYEGYNAWESIPMTSTDGVTWQASLPDDKAWQKPGKLEYAITVEDSGEVWTFPGKQKGKPQNWDFLNTAFYHTLLQPENTPVTLLDPARDRSTFIAPQDTVSWPASSATQEGATVVLNVFDEMIQQGGPLLRTDLAVGNRLTDRKLDDYDAVALRVRASGGSDRLQLGFIANDGLAYGTDFPVSKEWKTLVIPLSAFKPVPLLFTRAYPTFMPVTTGPFDQAPLSLNAITGLQFSLPPLKRAPKSGYRGIELGEVALINTDN